MSTAPAFLASAQRTVSVEIHPEPQTYIGDHHGKKSEENILTNRNLQASYDLTSIETLESGQLPVETLQILKTETKTKFVPKKRKRIKSKKI